MNADKMDKLGFFGPRGKPFHAVGDFPKADNAYEVGVLVMTVHKIPHPAITIQLPEF
jgi:hypothetical protein